MGGAALIGLGLAQAQPGKRVVLTGDGEQLMGLGGLATIGVARPRNLAIVVIDNQHFGETGTQPSHTGRGVDLTAIAMACGFVATGTVRTLEEVERLATQLDETVDGPRLFVIKVLAENPPRSLPSRDAVFYQEPVPCSSWFRGGLSRVSLPATACPEQLSWSETMKLTGKVAAITGAARGIGKACAKQFLDDGVKVVISDVDADGLAATAAELGRPDALRTVIGNVAKRADVDQLVATAVKEFGRLDIMVNNAGVARNRDLLDISEEEFDEIHRHQSEGRVLRCAGGGQADDCAR